MPFRLHQILWNYKIRKITKMYFLMRSSSPQCVKTHMEVLRALMNIHQLEVFFFLCSKTFHISFNTRINGAERAHSQKPMTLEVFVSANYQIFAFLLISLSPH